MVYNGLMPLLGTIPVTWLTCTKVAHCSRQYDKGLQTAHAKHVRLDLFKERGTFCAVDLDSEQRKVARNGRAIERRHARREVAQCDATSSGGPNRRHAAHRPSHAAQTAKAHVDRWSGAEDVRERVCGRLASVLREWTMKSLQT